LKLIVVTPAGRERYLRLLSHYVLGSAEVVEWHLWDNCRNEADRAYLQTLADKDPRCKIKRLAHANGTIHNIGDFFQFCDDREAIYLRLDDDIVYVEPDFFPRFKARMLEQRGKALWYAPLIVNNAICSSLIQTLSKVELKGPITTQASCPDSWALPSFPIAMHPVLIDAVETGRIEAFRVPDREVRLSRFSINAIAFFGDEIVDMGAGFLPPDRNEEEWYSALLPMKLNRPGLVLGDLLVSHFSFYTQEAEVLRTDILERYYRLAGVAWDQNLIPPPKVERKGLRQFAWLYKSKQRAKAWPQYQIRLPARA
jgi:hypothetical protein